mgnify:CR=1 FL=1
MYPVSRASRTGSLRGVAGVEDPVSGWAEFGPDEGARVSDSRSGYVSRLQLCPGGAGRQRLRASVCVEYVRKLATPLCLRRSGCRALRTAIPSALPLRRANHQVGVGQRPLPANQIGWRVEPLTPFVRQPR